MGKVATAAAEMNQQKKKKKGRPPKNSISTPPKPINSNPATSRRSRRRNPSNLYSPPQPEFDDDDDERKEKKVKLVVRLPQSDEKPRFNKRRHSQDYDSGSESDQESEDDDALAKRRKISAGDRGSEGAGPVQDEEAVIATDTPQHDSELGPGPTTHLPDKKLLVFILDRLQKKDTRGVFSEPVDPDELPDYFEIIEQPMDFGTVRNKLETGAYKNLDELEADVLLICSNAMQYNTPSSVYYRQARNIQELAKRDFSNLRHEGDEGEPQPKVVRRGRPPGQKSQKKLLETSPVLDRVAPEGSSGATLATGEDRAIGSNSYNLRKPPGFNRFRYTDPFMSSYRWKNGENYSESADWNNEFPASILRADMKHGKRNIIVDENRRDTYRQFHPLSSSSDTPTSSTGIGDVKRLVPVGLQEPLAYARSLSRYAAALGPVAWKIASQKIEATIPPGTQYGPGWVGYSNGTSTSSYPLSFSTEMRGISSNSTLTRSTSDPSSTVFAQWQPNSQGMVEAVMKLNDQGEGPSSSWRTTSFPPQQKPTAPLRNGFTTIETAGYDLSSSPTLPENRTSLPPVNPAGGTQGQMWNFGKTPWPILSMQQMRSVSVAPDLNVRVTAGSPSSGSIQIGSPRQQPDLALQL